MNLVIVELDELEKLIRKIIREEIQGINGTDEIGGMNLATEITGLKCGTIYKKIAHREIPFRQEVKGGRIRFSRNDLLDWLKVNAR